MEAATDVASADQPRVALRFVIPSAARDLLFGLQLHPTLVGGTHKQARRKAGFSLRRHHPSFVTFLAQAPNPAMQTHLAPQAGRKESLFLQARRLAPQLPPVPQGRQSSAASSPSRSPPRKWWVRARKTKESRRDGTKRITPSRAASIPPPTPPRTSAAGDVSPDSGYRRWSRPYARCLR